VHNSVVRVLAAAVDRLIPEDNWPSGWRGGVERYLLESADVGWAIPELEALASKLDVAAGPAGFIAAGEDQQDAILHDFEHELDTLLRITWEGYYAAEAGRRPVGLDMLGFRSVPDGVVPIEPEPLRTVDPRDVERHYDAIVIGTGPGGGAAAEVLAQAGKRVLLVERSRQKTNAELRGDHLHGKRNAVYRPTAGPGAGHPRVIEDADGREIVVDGDGDGHRYGLNAMLPGGGTRIWQAMSWRFMPEDFRMATTYGVPEGSSLADWPIGYDDLEPFYSRAEHKLGVSAEQGGLTSRTRRSADYPMPPIATEPAREVLGAAANRLGLSWGPAPLGINSVPRDGRAACVRCFQCIGHACPVNAKNGSQNTVIPRAIATGNCDLLLDAQAVRITETAGGATVTIMADASSAPRELSVSADVIVVSAGAIETPRLLLASGLGNDQLGRNLHAHHSSMVAGIADREIKTYQGPGHSVATLDHAHSGDTPWGGGVLFDLNQMLPLTSAAMAPQFGAAPWGADHKRWMRDDRSRILGIFCMGQDTPVPTSRVTLSPSVRDRWGMPAAAFRKDLHWSTIELADALAGHGMDWLRAAGIEDVIRLGAKQAVVSAAGEHSVGTARMGDDPASSACDRFGKVHGASRVYVCDGSLHPTNGGVNPALTILANAFRVAEHLAANWPSR
jgi:choline dehydrogenase-like flavoprotein